MARFLSSASVALLAALLMGVAQPALAVTPTAFTYLESYLEIVNNDTKTVRDAFGTAICSIGDLDGDSIDDLAVGAPRHGRDLGGNNRDGAVYILFMNANGTVKSDHVISATSGDALPTLFPQFGSKLAHVGSNVIAVSYYGNGPGIILLTLNTDGSVASYQPIRNGVGGFVGRNDDYFGSGLHGIGDFDGDANPDLAVGAERYPDNYEGAVYLLFLNQNSTVKETHVINSTSLGGALPAGGAFGGSVASADVDGDAVTDLIVGAFLESSNKGAVYILYMNDNATVRSHVKFTPTDLPALSMVTYFGLYVACQAQADYVQLAVQDQNNYQGRVTVLNVFSNGTLNDYIAVVPSELGLPSTPAGGLGYGVQFGDFNNDGFLDLAAGRSNQYVLGSFFLMFGGTAPPAGSTTGTTATSMTSATSSSTSTSSTPASTPPASSSSKASVHVGLIAVAIVAGLAQVA